jgi:uncharacterized protein involved in exopolysaccharide biosynthesis
MTESDTILRAIRTIARRWMLFAGWALAVGIPTAAISVLGQRDYIVPLAFVAESDGEGGGGIADALGLGGSSADSPDFYVDLLKTNEAMLPLLSHRYRTSEGEDISLVELMKVKGGTEQIRVAQALKQLKKRIIPTSSRRSGVVSVMIRMPDPLVAKTVADELLGAINTVNLRVRQTKGRNDRKFTEERLTVLRSELRVAEEYLRQFLETHRIISSSPSLQLQRLRAEREVTLKSSALEAMQLSYEAARREEVKNTPRISVIEPPRVPAIGMPRNTARKALISMILTFLVLFMIAYRADRRAEGSIRRLLREDIQRFRRMVAAQPPPSAVPAL